MLGLPCSGGGDDEEDEGPEEEDAKCRGRPAWGRRGARLCGAWGVARAERNPRLASRAEANRFCMVGKYQRARR